MLFFIVLGAMISIGTSWASALINAPFYRKASAPRDDNAQNSTWRLIESQTIDGGVEVAIRVTSHDGATTVNTSGWAQSMEYMRDHPSERWKWIVPLLKSDLKTYPIDSISETHITARGWPAICMAESVVSVRDAGGDITRLIHGGITADRKMGRLRIIPLRPLWFGLVMNTSFYSTCILGIVVLVRYIRSRRRERRGCCKKCGYQVGMNVASGCPECGWNRPENGQQAGSQLHS